MSARRLAIRQPDSFELSAKAKKEIATWIKKYPEGRQRSALIPALWIAQKDAGGWLPEKALRAVGDLLGMAYIRVYEVATFYTMFALEPVGTHFVQMCGTTPCWLRGSDELKDMLIRKIGPQKTLSSDGKLSWLEVECLGSCSNAPMVQISNDAGDHYYEDLTAESLEAVLDAFVAGETPKAGPQNSRHTSEPEGGAIVLKTPYAFRKLTKLPNAVKKVPMVQHAGATKQTKAKATTKPKAKAAAPKKAAAKKPQVIYKDGPTDGTPDDLKKIKGIGPKFEGDLNSKGIYYFRQIGAWKVADIKMVEELIDSIPGRIKRDEWVKQARLLAKSAAKPDPKGTKTSPVRRKRAMKETS